MEDPLTVARDAPAGRFALLEHVATLIAASATIISCTENVRVIGTGAARTESYIRRLDVEVFERRGTDFANPDFSPARLGIPVDELDIMVDSDYAGIAALRRELQGVDRRIALQHIFAIVTAGARNDAERHRAVLSFLQKSSFHNGKRQPLESPGRSLKDPLIILELGEMHCGNVARLAVDLFESAGFDARLIQLGGHLVAEVEYDGQWHYLDADIFGSGETVVLEDGTIPSVDELGYEPFRIDALAHYRELQYPGVANVSSLPYPSWHFFSKESYGQRTGLPAFYEKVATVDELTDKRYGWDHILTVPDPDRPLYDFEPRHQPGAVTITQYALGRADGRRRMVHLGWTRARDRDSDLLGYRVFVSRRSRGWAYERSAVPEHLRQLVTITTGWRPDMYERLFELPPDDVARLQTSVPALSFSLETGSTYFITIMPFDSHGEAVGKILYQMSDELRISL